MATFWAGNSSLIGRTLKAHQEFRQANGMTFLLYRPALTRETDHRFNWDQTVKVDVMQFVENFGSRQTLRYRHVQHFFCQSVMFDSSRFESCDF